MARFVDADRLFEYIDEQKHLSKGKVLNYIRENHTDDVIEAKHGKWKKQGNEKECSLCKFIYYSNNDDFTYCPNCGAMMESKTK